VINLPGTVVPCGYDRCLYMSCWTSAGFFWQNHCHCLTSTGPCNSSYYFKNICVQNGSGAHPASYPMSTRGSFPGVNRPGHEADRSPPSSAEVKECVELYFHSPKTPSGCGAQLKHRDFTFFCYKAFTVIIGAGVVHSVQWLELRTRQPGFDVRQGQGFYSSPPRPDRLWVPPILLANGKRSGRWPLTSI
jgi:hypothetical protein